MVLKLADDVLPGRSVVENSAILEACNSALAKAYGYLSEQVVSGNEVSGVEKTDLENITATMIFVTSQILQTKPPGPDEDPKLSFRRLETLSRMASHLDTFLDEAVVTVARFGSANLDDYQEEEPVALDYYEAVTNLNSHLRPALNGLTSGKMNVQSLMGMYHARQISGLVYTHWIISKMSAALQNRLDTSKYRNLFGSAEGNDAERAAEVTRLAAEIDDVRSSLVRFTLDPGPGHWSALKSLHSDLHDLPPTVSTDLHAWAVYWACGRGARLNYDTVSWSTMGEWPQMYENMKDLLQSLEVLSLNGISLKYEPTLDGGMGRTLLQNAREALSKVKRPDPATIPLSRNLVNEGFKKKILLGGSTISKRRRVTLGGDSSAEEIFDIDVQEYKDYLSKSGRSSMALRADFARTIQNARKPMDDLYLRSVRLVLPEVALQHAVLGMWKGRFETLDDPGDEVLTAHTALQDDADEIYVSLFSLLQASDPNMSAEELKGAPRPLSKASIGSGPQIGSGSGLQSGKKGKTHRRKDKKGKGKATSSRQDENEQEQSSSSERLSQIREILKGSQYESFNTLTEFSKEWSKRMALTHLGGIPLSQEARTRIMSGRSGASSSGRGRRS